jgi:hypothetical protein
MFNGKLKQVVGIFLLPVILTSCDCGCDPEEYGVHKFKPGNTVHHKMTGDPLLVIDTFRTVGCKLQYVVTDKYMKDHTASEMELK